MQERQHVVISAWIPQSLAEAIRLKAFLQRRSKSDLVRTLLVREFSDETTSHEFDVAPPTKDRHQ